jgi:hypothetical protein
MTFPSHNTSFGKHPVNRINGINRPITSDTGIWACFGHFLTRRSQIQADALPFDFSELQVI